VCPDTPFILVGTKTDLREDEETINRLKDKGKEAISTKVGSQRAKDIKAKYYLECSSKDLPSVNEIFQKAVKVVMDPLKERKKQVAKLAKKEEKEEKKLEEKIEKARKKLEEKERKKKDKEIRESSGEILPSGKDE